MKIFFSIVISVLLLTSCLDTEGNQSVFSFSNSPASVFDFPKGDTSQYLLYSTRYNIWFLPDMLPDSLKADGIQILFSGVTYDEYEQVVYSDPESAELKTALIQTLKITSAKTYQQDMIVRYGTSFGECLGYCEKSLTLSDGKIEFLYESTDTALQDVSCDLNISSDSTNKVLNFVNIPVINEMNTFYGCPDCDDGGAEWIEIEFQGIPKKITFEYMNEPEEITNIVDVLRRFATYSDCTPVQ